MGSSRQWPNLTYYPSIYLKELRTTTNILHYRVYSQRFLLRNPSLGRKSASPHNATCIQEETDCYCDEYTTLCYTVIRFNVLAAFWFKGCEPAAPRFGTRQGRRALLVETIRGV
jgi:hypothetical protein